MKSFKVICISGLEKVQRKFESAIVDPAISFSHVETPEKCLDLLVHQEAAFLIYCDEFKPDIRNAFFKKLNALDKFNRGINTLVFTKSEAVVTQCANIYTTGVVDHLPFNASFTHINTRFEVYKRLYKKKTRIRELIENIMPPDVADELEKRGKFPPRRHGLVTVMFTDFVRFTEKTEEVHPVELVNLLDSYYVQFDKIIKDHKLEKIKTIGDAYMCAGGVPKRIGFNPVRVTLAAIAIRAFMEKMARQNKFKGKPVWNLRIGINSGHVVSGIVGKLKYCYDIWGETVNVAARMEANGEGGQINISEATYEHIKPYFECEYRGKIAAKYIGAVKMYFVKRLKPEYSVSGNGHTPTAELKQLAGIIKLDYEGAKEYMFARLRNELPDYLEYHGWHHTLNVLQSVEYLGAREKLLPEDQVLINTAAIYHDCGYLESYWNNEEIAVKTARQTLPKFGYTTSQINIICSIIRSTKVRAIPKTKLEKIMNDADYDYLGKPEYTKIAAKLYKEWQHLGTNMPRKQWLQTQVAFLEKHRYYTKAAIALRKEQKLRNIAELKAKLA
ncbi:MAG TPA: adenylate/guanylate cyclase domain-containing protein [Flavobacteriales bacterium]|nr:adenylate/guanylate cyclase domain-containing protein [Flavobacteriales bacterium]